MGGYPSRRVWACVLLLAAATVAGCSSLDRSVARIKGEPITDVVPGVPSPAERVAALGQIGEKAGRVGAAEQAQLSAELAAEYQNERDPAIRAEIVRAATGYRTEMAGSLLAKALKDADADVRISACEALGARGGAEAVGLLSGSLASDMDTDVRLAAVAALGQTGDSAAVAALGQALEDRDPAMQYRAVESLRQVTGKDLGNNVNDWRQFVQAGVPTTSEPVSLAERLGGML